MSTSRILVRRGILTILIVVAVALGAGLFARVIPAGFIPDEDQGIFGVNVQLPPGASLERTSAVLKKVEDILAKTEGIDSFQTVGGYGAVTSTYQPNYGSIFARLHPWEERKGEALHVKGIMAGLQRKFAAIPEAIIFPFNIPTLAGFGASSGFNFLLQDRTGSMSVEELGDHTRKFCRRWASSTAGPSRSRTRARARCAGRSRCCSTSRRSGASSTPTSAASTPETSTRSRPSSTPT